MRTRRLTVDFEELRRIANRVRTDTLNAIDELVIRTMAEGKDVEALSRRVKKALSRGLADMRTVSSLELSQNERGLCHVQRGQQELQRKAKADHRLRG